MRFFIIVVGTIFLLSSCVPNRKYVYLQKDDVNKKDLIKDSVLRTYDLKITDYRIQPLDLLYVRIESLTEEDYDFISKLYPLTQEGAGGNIQPISAFLVDDHGDIEFPVVGKINFIGLTIFGAQEKVEQVFSPYLKKPVARVRLLNFRFTVLGEVNRENQVVSSNTRVTVMEAIGLAGGLTELADRSNVKIIRQHGDQSEVFYVNLLEEKLLESDYFYVHQNDLIVVPALKQRPFRRYFGENLALFVSTITAALLIVTIVD